MIMRKTSDEHKHLEGQGRKLKGHLLHTGHGTLKAGMSKVRPNPGTEFVRPVSQNILYVDLHTILFN